MKNFKSVALGGESLSKFTPYVIVPPSDGLGSNFWSSIWTSFILNV